MGARIDAARCAELFAGADDIVLLSHRDPDGDTLGCAFGLYHALAGLGKRVRIECESPFPRNLGYFVFETPQEFEPRFVCALDTASAELLGALRERYPAIDLCIDHHPTNPLYARETFLAPYAAAGEAVYEVLEQMKVPVTPEIATALYTALATDTGSFKHSNTSPQTHRYAADLMECGADFNATREWVFESKSRGLVQLEAEAMQNIGFYGGGRVSVVKIPRELIERTGVCDDELDGVSARALQIENVLCGVTLKEKADGVIRVSVRSASPVDASRICARFGGGGHKRAAGCRLGVSMEEAERLIAQAAVEELL